MTDKPKNPVKDRIMKESSDVIGMVYSELVEKSGDMVGRLPEPIFVDRFLPLFSGQIKREDRPELMAEWIGVAGSAVGEVSIIDQKGDELYRVPPIFDTSFITKNPSGGRYDHIVNKANLLSNHVPAKGDRFLTQALEKKFEQMDGHNHHHEKDEERWMKIFSRYNVGNNANSNKAAGSSDTGPSIVDDEIYD